MPPSPASSLLEQLDQLEKLRNPRPEPGQLRQFTRFVVRGVGEITPMDPHATQRGPVEVQLRDVGLGGVGFVTDQPLEAGSYYRICFFARSHALIEQHIVVRFVRPVAGDVFLCGAQFCAPAGLLALLGVEADDLNREISVADEAENTESDFDAPDRLGREAGEGDARAA